MYSKVYKKTVIEHIVSVMKNTAVSVFLLSLLFVMLLGDYMPAVMLSNVVLFVCIIYEVLTDRVITVHGDCVTVKTKNSYTPYNFDTFHFSSDAKQNIVVEDKRSKRTSRLNIGQMSIKRRRELANDIQKNQARFYMQKSASGEYRSGMEIKTESKRAPASNVKPSAEKPVHDLVPRREATELKFHYPQRDIVDAAERSGVIFTLSYIAVCVGIFLVWYLLFGTAVTALKLTKVTVSIAAVCVVFSALIIIVKKMSVTGLLSKIEVCDEYVIIDGKHYKYSNMQNMHMTSPTALRGERILEFFESGKRYIYNLGGCAKPKNDRELRYFSRYGELASALRKRGFSYR